MSREVILCEHIYLKKIWCIIGFIVDFELLFNYLLKLERMAVIGHCIQHYFSSSHSGLYCFSALLTMSL